MLRSWRGAIITVFAGSLPCSAMAVLLTVCFGSWSKDPTAQIALKGALVAAIAVMAITVGVS
jgi:chromate transport protein ChrA